MAATEAGSLVAVAPAHLAVVAAVAVAVAVAAGAEAVTEVAAALRAAAAVLVVPVGSAVAEAVTEVTGWSGSPTRWRVRMSDMSLFFFRIARLRVQGAKWQSADFLRRRPRPPASDRRSSTAGSRFEALT